MAGRISALQHNHTPAHHTLALMGSVFVAVLNMPQAFMKHFGYRRVRKWSSSTNV